MKILFLHGWHSVPGGVKPTYLKDHGHEVINPALDDDDFAAALVTAIEPTRLRLDRSKRLPHFTVQFALSGSPVGHVVTVSSA